MALFSSLPPAVKALFAQLGGWLIAYALNMLFSLSAISPWSVIAAQALSAATLAWLMSSARWWIPIHLGFMPAAMLLQGAPIAPGWYLAAFIALTLIYWNTFRTQVPLYLSSPEAIAAVEALLPRDRPFRFLDLGCGTGTLLIPLAKRFPNGHFVGIESAPGPYWVARSKAKRLPNVELRLGDYFQDSWRDYDFLYAFLSPAPMPRVGAKARRELAPTALLISNSFPIPDWAPKRVIPLSDAGNRVLYLYHHPEKR